MNECQRSVLQRHLKQLANDLILSEELLSDLFQHRIFDRTMISMIKGQATESDRVYKMLEILPKRGPSAFDTFINIIQDSYPWLAAMLESSYHSEKSRQASNSGGQSVRQERLFSFTENTPRYPDRFADPEIRKRVGTFVHKQFGQSKRISQNDKKAVEKFLNDQLTEERMRLQLSIRDKSDSLPDTETESEVSQANDVQQRLFEIHVTLEPYLQRKTDVPSLPEDMSFDLIRQEINEILERLNKAEREVKQCLDLPGLKGDEELDLSLCCYIEKLIEHVNDQQEKLENTEKHLTQLQKELNEYSMHIEKLEVERSNSRNKVELLNKEVSNLRHDKFRLEERCNQLEKIHRQHIEKEKTLENLRSVVRDLQTAKVNQSSQGNQSNHGNQSHKSNAIEDSMNIRSKELNVVRNSIRRSFRTTGDRFGRTTPRPSLNYQIPRTRYTTVKSGPKKRMNQPGQKS